MQSPNEPTPGKIIDSESSITFFESVILESIDSKLNALDTDLKFPNP